MEMLNLIFAQVNGVVGSSVMLDQCGFFADYDIICKSKCI